MWMEAYWPISANSLNIECRNRNDIKGTLLGASLLRSADTDIEIFIHSPDKYPVNFMLPRRHQPLVGDGNGFRPKEGTARNAQRAFIPYMKK